MRSLVVLGPVVVMGQTFGADPDQLEKFGAQLEQAGERLDSIRGGISSALNHSHWEGGDAEEFRSQWGYQLSGMLHTATLAARAAATTVRTNAQQQRDASGAGSGASDPALVGRMPGKGGDGAGSVGHDSFDDFFDQLTFPMLGLSAISLGGDIAKAVMTSAKMVLPAVLKDVAVSGTSGMAKGAQALVGGLDEVGGPLGLVGLGLDGIQLLHGVATNPDDPKNYQSGVDVLLDVAAIAAVVAFPEGAIAIGIGMGAAHLGYDLVSTLDPNLTKDFTAFVGKPVVAATKALIDVNKAVGDVEQKVVEGAAGAVSNVVSGGVNAVSHWLPF